MSVRPRQRLVHIPATKPPVLTGAPATQSGGAAVHAPGILAPPSTVVRLESAVGVAAELCRALATERALLAEAEARATRADAEIERLLERVRELESWLEGSAHFERVENLQLGRVLARAAAEREDQRLPRFASLPFVAAAGYVAAVATFVWVMLGSHV